MKSKKSIYDGRIKLIKKIENKKYYPTSEELEEAYGYLNYCWVCGKKFKWIERLPIIHLFTIQHGILGNCHAKCGV